MNLSHCFEVLVRLYTHNIQMLNLGQQELPGWSRRLRLRLNPNQQFVITHNETHGVKDQDAILNPRNIEMPSTRFLFHKDIIFEYL